MLYSSPPPPPPPPMIEQVNRSTRELIKNLLKRTLSRNTSACENIGNVQVFQSTCFIIWLFYQYSIYATEALFKFRSELHRVQSCWFTLYKWSHNVCFCRTAWWWIWSQWHCSQPCFLLAEYIHVPCIYLRARWELVWAPQFFAVVFIFFRVLTEPPCLLFHVLKHTFLSD